MRKIFLTGGLVVAMASGLAACSSRNDAGVNTVVRIAAPATACAALVTAERDNVTVR